MEGSVLKSEIWNGERWLKLEANAETSSKIEGCDWFHGSVLLVVKDLEKPEGLYQKEIFGGGRRRMFEVQVQGQFVWEKVPGTLWVGGELEAERMKLSGLSRFAAKAALGFVRAAAGAGSSLSYSFGDPLIEELPHITAPLFSSMPTVGYDLGRLGESTHELESASERRKRKADALYAQDLAKKCRVGVILALNSAIVDPRHWTAKLPGLPPLDLHRLWEDNKLVLAFYALDHETDFSSQAKHTKKNKHYFLKLRLSHTVNDTSGSSYNESLPYNAPRRPPLSLSVADLSESTQGKKKILYSHKGENDEEEDDDKEEIFYDARTEMLSASCAAVDDDDDDNITFMTAHSVMSTEPSPPKKRPPSRRVIGCGSIFTRALRRGSQRWRDSNDIGSLIGGAVMAQTEPRARCFGWVSVFDLSHGRRDYYIIVETETGQTHLRRRRGKCIASAEEATAWIDTVSTRLSLAEKRRRRFDATLAGISQLDDAKNKMNEWLGLKSSADDIFLKKGRDRGLISSKLIHIPALCSGLVARASSTRCWREEFAVLATDATLTCFDEKARPVYRISIADRRDFLGATAVLSSRSYLDNIHTPRRRRRTSAFERSNQYAALEITCIDRVLRLVLSSVAERDRWLEAIVDCAAANRSRSSFYLPCTTTTTPHPPPFPEEEEKAEDDLGIPELANEDIILLERQTQPAIDRRAQSEDDDDDDDSDSFSDTIHNEQPTRHDLRQVLAAPGNEWKPAGRWILNARTLFDDNLDPNDEEVIDPLALVSSLVRAGYALLASGPGTETNDLEDTEQYLSFIRDADRLRNCAPRLLDENSRLVFWLNVYHTLIAHASLLYGSPRKPTDFSRHFSSLCYEIDGDVASLAEIEHHILLHRDKNALVKPFISDLLRLRPRFSDISLLRATISDLKATPYASAISSTDLRLFFALNPGSRSTPSTVQLYTLKDLNTQLDQAASLALASASLSRPLSPNREALTPRRAASEDNNSTSILSLSASEKLFLPRICAWRRLSLGDIFQFLDPALQERLLAANLVAPRPADNTLVASPYLHIRYLPFFFSCRTLQLV